MTKRNKLLLSPLRIQNIKATEKRQLFWDTKTKGLVLAVEPTGRKRFKYFYSFHGRSRWYTMDAAVGLGDARETASKLAARVTLGEDVCQTKADQRAAAEAEQNKLTWEALVERYGRDYAEPRQKRWAITKRSLTLHTYPTLKHRKIDAIKRSDIEPIFKKLTADGKPEAANKLIANISPVFNWAIKQQVYGITLNPCFGIDKNPKEHETGIDYNDDEIKALWPAFEQTSLIACSVLKLMLITGQRNDDLHDIRWDDIDGHWLTVRDYKTKKKGEYKPHMVYLTDAALEVLEDMKPAISDYVFPKRTDKNKPVANIHGHQLTKVRELCPQIKFTPHNLRHTVESKMAKLGVHKEHRDAILNHATTGMTKVYNHWDFATQKKEAALLWERHLLQILGKVEVEDNVLQLSGS